MPRLITPETPSPFLVYRFSELSPEAQETAVETEQNLRAEWGNDWAHEWAASRDAFLRCYGLTRCRMDRDGESIYPDSDHIAFIETVDDEGYSEETDEPLTGDALAEYLRDESPEQGDCTWTGYGGDESFLDEVFAFIATPDSRNRAEVLADAYAEGIRQWKEDDEWQYAESTVREYLMDDDREYYEDGTLY